MINTHHHGDHAGGDPVFAKIAPIIVAPERARPHSERLSNAAKNAPAAVARAQQDLEAARAAKDSAKIAQAQDQLGRAQMNAKMVAVDRSPIGRFRRSSMKPS